MKRLAAILMIIFMLIPMVAVVVSAEETADNPIGSDAISFTCNYSTDAKKIEIRGNVKYDILVTYGKHKIEILRIAPYQTPEQALGEEEPNIAAEMDIAAKFDMSFDINSSVEKFYQYAVVLCSPDNVRILASEPQYVLVASSFNYSGDKKGFKGISVANTSELSISGDMGFGSAVIPVYYDKLINESLNGYIYPHEDTHCYFDKTYIDELDTKIRTYSATGAKVYLQLLMTPNISEKTLLNNIGDVKGAESIMPDVYDLINASKISTYVRFLSSRYDNYSSGIISGIIVGKQIDRDKYNYSGGLSLDDHAKKYAFYMTVVANSARMENPYIDIIVPISNHNTYGTESIEIVGGYVPSVLLEKIFGCLDSFFLNEMNCSIMIENNTAPIGVSNSDPKNNIFSPNGEQEQLIGLNNLVLFERFIYSLDAKYRSAPKCCMYYWCIPKDMSGNLLECAYAYSYYTLFGKSKISSFVVSFSDTADTTLQTVSPLLKNIDTGKGTDESARLLKHFGVSSWSELISGYSGSGYALRTEYLPSAQNINGKSWLGSFSYFDFSTGGTKGWYGGAYNKGLRADYGAEWQRGLHQTVSRANGAAHSDLYCLYEFDENYVYTPAIKLITEITDNEDDFGAVYEITVTVGSDTRSVTQSYVVSSGQPTDLWLDMSGYNSENKASYIKISTRCISGIYDEYSLWLYNVIGYSAEYNNEQLYELINTERLKIRNQSYTDDGGNSDNIMYWIVFAIILVAICIGGLMFTILRRDDSSAKRRKSD